MIAIIDYKAGNQTSVKRALEFLKIEAEITADPARLKMAQGVIFPGVGAAGQAMELLTETGLAQVICELAQSKPFLGICLGCQIMLETSEEDGGTKTLGIIAGENPRFSPTFKEESGEPIRIPHMGWNSLKKVQDNLLFEGLGGDEQFYFVHSYYPKPDPRFILGLTSYGIDFASVFGQDGLWAVQFHPEKSGPAGLRLLQNFHQYSVLNTNK